MPVRRKYNYRNRNKKYGKRNRYKRKMNKLKQTKVNLSGGIPDRMFIKMKYGATINLSDVTGGLSQYYEFRGNSCYDPDYTSGSLLDDQPVSFDQWTAFYREYRVMASKIDIEAYNYNTTSPNSSVILVAMPSATPIQTTIGALEAKLNPYAKYIAMAPASGGPQRRLTNYMTTKKMYGVPNLDDNLYYGDTGGSGVGSNPAASWIWNVTARNVNPTETFNIQLLVTITYYVELSNRHTLGLS